MEISDINLITWAVLEDENSAMLLRFSNVLIRVAR